MVAFTNPVKDVVASGRESGLSTGSACRKESAETFPTAGNSPKSVIEFGSLFTSKMPFFSQAAV